MKIISLVEAALKDFEVGNYDSAIEKYNSVISDEPECSSHYVQRAQCYLKTGQFQKSVDDVKCALERDPQNIMAVLTGGRAATKLAKYEDAYNFYKAGLSVDPKNVDIEQDLKTLQNVILEDYENQGGDEDEKGYKAVNLCGNDPYPGDDEILKLEYEILEQKYGLVSKVTEPTKNKERTERAAKIAMEAHSQMLGGNFNDALQLFTAAVDLEPTNNVLRRLRAEVRFLTQDIIGAMKDLWLIPKKDRNSDTWKLGGKLLLQLQMPVSSEFWFRKAYVLSGKKDEEAAIMFQKIRVRRLYDPLTKNFPVFVDFTDYGRGLFALRDIKKGEIVLEDVPAVMGRVLCKDKQIITGCDYCATSLLTPAEYFGAKWNTLGSGVKELVTKEWPDTSPVKCDKCQKVSFCSDTCKDKAWDQYHEYICPARSQSAAKLYEISQNFGYGFNDKNEWVELWKGHFSVQILLRMWGSIVAETKRLMKEERAKEPTVLHWAKAKSPYRKFIAFGSGEVVKGNSEVFSLTKDLFADCGDGVKLDISEAEFTGRYYQCSCNLQSFSSPITPYHKFMNQLSKMDPDPDDTRAFQLMKFLEAKPPSADFCGIFPLHACLNHSCINNVEVSDGDIDGRGGVFVTAKTDISKGEELYTTYIDTSMPRRLRRAWLYKSFNFWCHCPRCSFEGDDPKLCTMCHTRSSDGTPFRACGNCKKAWYCTVECQRKAWIKGHKVACKTGHSQVAT